MATKSTKKSVSGSTKAGKSKAQAKGSKVAKVSVVKKTPAKARVVKISSVKASPAKAATSKKTKAQIPKVVTSKKIKAEAPKKSFQEKTKDEPPKKRHTTPRKGALKKILLAKRKSLVQQMQAQLGQSLTDEQQRRLEAAMDSGDQALVDLDREMGISLQEMRNRERQMIDEALASLEEGTYGFCAECDVEISEKRLEALPFARYCIECQARIELMQKIEKGEQRS